MSKFISSLRHPIIVAPMAGGPSTPRLVQAAAKAGGFGFLGLGTTPATDVPEILAKMGECSYGVNLFTPQEPVDITPEIRDIFQELGVDDTTLPTPDYSQGMKEKIAAILKTPHPPAVVSTMFGVMPQKYVAQLQDRGCEVWATVVCPEDAVSAQAVGVDALVVQGPLAGGHRGTWDTTEEPSSVDLPSLVDAITSAGVTLPLIAAGGIRHPHDVAQLLSLPRVEAVSCGSMFLLADEAGTSDFNRRLLHAGGDTVCTRAFSGRYARGLATEFTQKHPNIPPMYPLLNVALKKRRQAQDTSVAYCLVGEHPEKIFPGSTADIIHWLSPNTRE